MRNRYQKEIFPAITQVIDQEIDTIALLLDYTGTETFSALAFQVNRINRRTEKYTELTSIANDSTLDYGYLGEKGHSEQVSEPGDSILRIEDNQKETIQELGVKVTPADFKVWIESPPNNVISGRQGDRVRGLGPGDDAGFVWSQYTQMLLESGTSYYVPTTALSPDVRQGLVKIDGSENQRNHIYFGFENQTGGSDTPELEIMGVTYRVVNVENKQKIRDIVFGRGVKRSVLTWGGLENDSPALPEGWSKVDLNDKSVKNLYSQLISG